VKLRNYSLTLTSLASVAPLTRGRLYEDLTSLPSVTPSSDRGHLYQQLVRFVMKMLDHFARRSSMCIRKFLQYHVLYAVLSVVDYNTSALYVSEALGLQPVPRYNETALNVLDVVTVEDVFRSVTSYGAKGHLVMDIAGLVRYWILYQDVQLLTLAVKIICHLSLVMPKRTAITVIILDAAMLTCCMLENVSQGCAQMVTFNISATVCIS